MRKNNKNSIKKFVEATSDLLKELGAENESLNGFDVKEFVLKTRVGNLFITLPTETTDEHDYVYSIYCRFKDSERAWNTFGGMLSGVNQYSGKYNLMTCGNIKKVISDMKFHFGMII